MQEEEEIPADATCLIYIAKVAGFETASRCFRRFLVTSAVRRESVVEGERFGYADAAQIRAAETSGVLRRVPLDAHAESTAAALAATWRLGQGESETLALGLRHGRAVVDDGRASRVAEAIGVEPVSTLFLPALGAERGLDRRDAIGFLHQLAIVTNARADAVLAIEELIRSRT